MKLNKPFESIEDFARESNFEYAYQVADLLEVSRQIIRDTITDDNLLERILSRLG